MEIISEGKNFRLLHDNELPSILDALEKFLPHSIKVSGAESWRGWDLK
jgi:hypothetical protein